VGGRIKKYKKTVLGFDKTMSFDKFLELLYKEMMKNYRNEYIFKNAIINERLLQKYGLKTTILLNEFKIGNSIADIILVNGEVRLFEIKTDLDNLNRLDRQLSDYQKAIGKIYIVTDSKNLCEINKRYSLTRFGIIELDNFGYLRQQKEALNDESFFEHRTIFKMLRKEEYLSIIKEKYKTLPDVPNTKIFKESLKLIERLDVVSFQKMAFSRIKNRMPSLSKILDKPAPDELKLLCYVLGFNEEHYEKLFKLLKRRI